jgi:RNA-directed DNA polymerase
VERSGRSAHSEDAAVPGLEVSLWEQMLAPENLSRALKRVRANRGAPGVDGMTTEEFVPWLREHRATVRGRWTRTPTGPVRSAGW